MLVGVPKEIKDHEYRVGLTPVGVHALVEHGHQVVVETGAGVRVGFTDSEYVSAGAKIAQRAADCWAAELIVKVKELQVERKIRLVYPSRRALSHAARAFLDVVKAG